VDLFKPKLHSMNFFPITDFISKMICLSLSRAC
jgi:hypothetical protein